MSAHAHARPVGGVLLDRPMIILLALFGVAEAFIGYRFVAGIGAVSNMNDGYTWGIWEPVNVVVFTGIGAGAYSVGLLCYLLNQGRYHPLMRPAVLLGAIAYTLGGASIVVAVGRPWNIYWLAMPSMWNLSSVLLEVAICVMVYVTVLWIEVMPAVLDGAAERVDGPRAERLRRWSERLGKAMPYILALAMLLPTMHQSSLGGLMLIAGPKLHPLWHTPLLPLLALVSCMSMGLGAVVVLTGLLKQTWNAKSDRELLVDMSKVNAGLLLLYVALRLADIWASGKLHLLAARDPYLFVFAAELALFLVPAFLFLSKAAHNGRVRFWAALATVVGGALWRVDAYLTCYTPGEAWHYRPALGEIAVTVGMAAIGVAIFITVSKLFPVVVVRDAPATSVPASVAAFVLAFPRRESARRPTGFVEPPHEGAPAEPAPAAPDGRQYLATEPAPVEAPKPRRR